MVCSSKHSEALFDISSSLRSHIVPLQVEGGLLHVSSKYHLHARLFWNCLGANRFHHSIIDHHYYQLDKMPQDLLPNKTPNWHEHKDVILELRAANRPLVGDEGIIETMKRNYNFSATYASLHLPEYLIYGEWNLTCRPLVNLSTKVNFENGNAGRTLDATNGRRFSKL
jgi:hypothetical protein